MNILGEEVSHLSTERPDPSDCSTVSALNSEAYNGTHAKIKIARNFHPVCHAWSPFIARRRPASLGKILITVTDSPDGDASVRGSLVDVQSGRSLKRTWSRHQSDNGDAFSRVVVVFLLGVH